PHQQKQPDKPSWNPQPSARLAGTKELYACPKAPSCEEDLFLTLHKTLSLSLKAILNDPLNQCTVHHVPPVFINFCITRHGLNFRWDNQLVGRAGIYEHGTALFPRMETSVS